MNNLSPGHSITSEEMQDVLMDFGNWSKDISIEDLEANAKPTGLAAGK